MERKEKMFNYIVYTRKLNSFEDEVLFEIKIQAEDEIKAKEIAEKEREKWINNAKVKPMYVPMFDKLTETK